MKLQIGAGTSPFDGWTNLDMQPGPGIDVVANLDTDTIPLDDNSVDEIHGSHVIEHLANPLHAMSELWRIAKPDATITLLCPYGTSDDAWEDPDHKRAYTVLGFAGFAQPYHWRSGGYGYTGDWQADRIELHIDRGYIFAQMADDEFNYALRHMRNVVVQMSATLHAVKPARARDRALLANPRLVRVPVDVH